MKPSNVMFAEHLDSLFGPPDSIQRPSPVRGENPVAVFVYRDVPDEGMITGITYGLSDSPCPHWKLSRPEMILTVDSREPAWPASAGAFVTMFRGRRLFSYGETLPGGNPLSPDTQMDSFLIFAQSILDPEDARIEVQGYTIVLSQLYPIYTSEIDVLQKIGLEAFWKHPEFRWHEPGRKPIQG